MLGRYPNRECVTCGEKTQISPFYGYFSREPTTTCITTAGIVHTILISLFAFSLLSKIHSIIFDNFVSKRLNAILDTHSNLIDCNFTWNCVSNIFLTRYLIRYFIVSFYIRATTYSLLFFTFYVYKIVYWHIAKRKHFYMNFWIQSRILRNKMCISLCKSVHVSRAMIFDKIDSRKEVTPNHIYLHLRKEWTLVLRVSTLLHDASYGPLELIAHQYCLVRVANDDRSVCSITDS